MSKGKFLPKEVFLVSMARTPIGSFLGSLSSLRAPELGATAITAALKRAFITPKNVELLVMGQVLNAGCGQAPYRQAALSSGIPVSVDVFGIDKVCSSGLKSVSLAAQSIALGHCDVAVAGGMESMSNAPYFLRNARKGGYRYGDGELLDLILHDGLLDYKYRIHMGECAEKTAKEIGITRKDQDEYAIESYRRATVAWSSGFIPEKEVVAVKAESKDGRHHSAGKMITEDEEYTRVDLGKVARIKPAFVNDGSGTITAANASSLNDGAAAVVLMSGKKTRELGLNPLARILSFADAAVDPVDFAVAPSFAVQKALNNANVEKVDFHEINEAFSAVVIANMKLLNLDRSVVNLHGGAVSLGHPIGMSGCRILMSLINVLVAQGGRLGCASICNGGGGSSAMVIERAS